MSGKIILRIMKTILRIMKTILGIMKTILGIVMLETGYALACKKICFEIRPMGQKNSPPAILQRIVGGDWY